MRGCGWEEGRCREVCPGGAGRGVENFPRVLVAIEARGWVWRGGGGQRGVPRVVGGCREARLRRWWAQCSAVPAVADGLNAVRAALSSPRFVCHLLLPRSVTLISLRRVCRALSELTFPAFFFFLHSIIIFSHSLSDSSPAFIYKTFLSSSR